MPANTDRQIRTAKVPAGLNQIELRDDQVRGLLLRVYRGGARTWMLHYRRQEMTAAIQKLGFELLYTGRAGPGARPAA